MSSFSFRGLRSKQYRLVEATYWYHLVSAPLLTLLDLRLPFFLFSADVADFLCSGDRIHHSPTEKSTPLFAEPVLIPDLVRFLLFLRKFF